MKGQIIGEVFMYLMASAVFVLILAYGYNAILSFIEKQDQVAIIDLKKTLESSADRIMLSYGSIEKLDLRLPKKYNEICFTTYKPLQGSPGIKTPLDNGRLSPLIVNSWKTGDENVFLMPKQQIPILVKNTAVVDGACCIAPKGTFSLKLTGKGRFAEVTTWDPVAWPCI